MHKAVGEPAEDDPRREGCQPGVHRSRHDRAAIGWRLAGPEDPSQPQPLAEPGGHRGGLLSHRGAAWAGRDVRAACGARRRVAGGAARGGHRLAAGGQGLALAHCPSHGLELELVLLPSAGGLAGRRGWHQREPHHTGQ
eukprot:5849966-Pyramimonas_sp.AAC.1